MKAAQAAGSNHPAGTVLISDFLRRVTLPDKRAERLIEPCRKPHHVLCSLRILSLIYQVTEKMQPFKSNSNHLLHKNT